MPYLFSSWSKVEDARFDSPSRIFPSIATPALVLILFMLGVNFSVYDVKMRGQCLEKFCSQNCYNWLCKKEKWYLYHQIHSNIINNTNAFNTTEEDKSIDKILEDIIRERDQ